jgi:phosphoglycolate phosphatase
MWHRGRDSVAFLPLGKANEQLRSIWLEEVRRESSPPPHARFSMRWARVRPINDRFSNLIKEHAAMQKRLITFDLDGTLLDSGPEISAAVNTTLASYGIPPVDMQTIIGFIGQGTRELMRQVLTIVDPSLSEDALEAWLRDVMPRLVREYEAAVGTLAQAYPGVERGLATLLQAGVRMAVVSNKEHQFAQQLLSTTGLLSHFEMVIGGDSLSQKKPHPLPIHHVLEQLNVSGGDAAHVGDSRTDVETARSAGVEAWAVPYGYNYGEPIALAQPDRIFTSIDDLAGHVVN